MRKLKEVLDFLFLAGGAYLTAYGSIRVFSVAPDGADFMKCQLYVIQGLVMLLWAMVR